MLLRIYTRVAGGEAVTLVRRITRDVSLGRSKTSRSPDLDHIHIPSGKTVSRFHCSIRFHEDGIYLCDGADGAPSTGGTYVGGIPVDCDGVLLSENVQVVLSKNAGSLDSSSEYVYFDIETDEAALDETLAYVDGTDPGQAITLLQSQYAELRTEMSRISTDTAASIERIERANEQLTLKVEQKARLDEKQTHRIEALVTAVEKVAFSTRKTALLAIAAALLAAMTFAIGSIRDERDFGRAVDRILAFLEYAPAIIATLAGGAYAVAHPAELAGKPPGRREEALDSIDEEFFTEDL